jgi:hypothetical protein
MPRGLFLPERPTQLMTKQGPDMVNRIAQKGLILITSWQLWAILVPAGGDPLETFGLFSGICGPFDSASLLLAVPWELQYLLNH